MAADTPKITLVCFYCSISLQTHIFERALDKLQDKQIWIFCEARIALQFNISASFFTYSCECGKILNKSTSRQFLTVCSKELFRCKEWQLSALLDAHFSLRRRWRRREGMNKWNQGQRRRYLISLLFSPFSYFYCFLISWIFWYMNRELSEGK